MNGLWERALFGSQSAVIICRAGSTGFTAIPHEGAVNYSHLVSLLNDRMVCRLPVGEAFGRMIHVYVPGFVASDPDDVKRYNDTHSINKEATEFLSQWGFEGTVQGDCIIVAGAAISPRDRQESMIAARAQTLPEVMRDHAVFVKPKVDKNWSTIEALVEEKAVFALTEEAPSANKVAWLIHIMVTGLSKEPHVMAAVMEARAKYPELDEAMGALAQISQMYFAHRYEDFTDEPLHPHRDVEIEAPAGFSKRHSAVVH